MASNVLISVILFFASMLTVSSQAGPPQMPSLIDKIGAKGSYHMMSEVEVIKAGGAERLVIEEWVSLSLGQTRVDILQSGVDRVTYLTNGLTGERFVYQDYTCKLLLEKEVPYFFLKNFQIENNENFIKEANIFGIGPTWMMAKATKGQNYLKARFAPSLTRPQLFNYDMYGVQYYLNPDTSASSDTDSGYGLNLYFEPGDNIRPDPERELQLIDWVRKGKDDEPFVRARIIFFEEQLESDHLDLFDLPEGYGCKRAAEYSHPLEERYAFKPIDQNTPQQMTVDVALLLPHATDNTVWKAQTATVKIITGKMDGIHRYVIVETQQKVQPNEQPARIKRMKNIYDLSNDYHNLLYSIDKETSECKIWRTLDQLGPVIEFQENIANASGDQSAKKTQNPPTQIKFNIENLNALFSDNDEFHLIKTVEHSSGNLHMLIHERSVEKFYAGSLKGSASIVRKTVTKPNGAFGYSANGVQQTILTVYVYEAAVSGDDGATKQETRKRLMAKITMRLYGHTDITKHYLHKQLDISDCIDEQKKEYATIKYPLEFPNDKILASSLDNIYLQFIKTMSLVIGMEPTQLCKVDITFDNYNMFVHMLLVDGPPKHMRYKVMEGKAFDKQATSALMIEEIQSTSENCAQACEFYSCLAFSYCANSRCTIYIRETEPSRNAEKTLSDSIVTQDGCSVYEDNLGLVNHEMSPYKIIDRIHDWLKLTEDTADDQKEDQTTDTIGAQVIPMKVRSMADYLTLHVKLYGLRVAHLTPISIQSDLIDEDDLFVDRPLDGQPKKIRQQLGEKLVQAQYIIEREGRKFDVPSKDFAYSVMDHLSYQDCATFCQDTDCKSFSYCETEMECVITKMHRATMIKSHTVKNAHCTIFMRDYLSKFELFTNVPKPEKDVRSVKVKNARECASVCMENTHRDCLSFDFCSNGGQCFLYGQHGRTSVMKMNGLNARSEHRSDEPCDHYSRSYLVDFDKYLGAHLEVPQDAVSLVKKEEDQASGSSETAAGSIFTGIDTETCAKLCVENDNCSGFTACFDPLSSIKLECNLAQVQLKKSYVKREENCNTYLFSPRSQFYTLTRQVLPSDPKEAKNDLKESEEALTHTEQADSDQTQNGNYSVSWISIILLLLVGAAIGSVPVWSYKNKERLQEIVQTMRR